ncbi:MAG: glutathione peroxidase [Oleibacter sp.]|nr:glutathione peroxidase [Thalassolituus sp.]
MSILDGEMPLLNGQQQSLSEYQGKVVLIVNTASKCGFTPQYEGLQTLYDDFKDQDFVILGFPCNQFGKQEPGAEEVIGAFCQKNYGVDFPMFAKINVNGPDAAPVYNRLKEASPGVLGTKAIKWNFTKFLLNREGEVVGRFGSATKPESLRSEITHLL